MYVCMHVCINRNEIPSEIFVAQTRYTIASKDVLAFEQAFNKVTSNGSSDKEGGMEESAKGDGFVGSFLQRRDADKVHSCLSLSNYIHTYIHTYTYVHSYM